MTMDDADEQVTLMDAESSPSSMFICVRRDLRPLRYHIKPMRGMSTVLIANGRHDDRIVR
jgi:hypothetical protein